MGYRRIYSQLRELKACGVFPRTERHGDVVARKRSFCPRSKTKRGIKLKRWGRWNMMKQLETLQDSKMLWSPLFWKRLFAHSFAPSQNGLLETMPEWHSQPGCDIFCRKTMVSPNHLRNHKKSIEIYGTSGSSRCSAFAWGTTGSCRESLRATWSYSLSYSARRFGGSRRNETNGDGIARKSLKIL